MLVVKRKFQIRTLSHVDQVNANIEEFNKIIEGLRNQVLCAVNINVGEPTFNRQREQYAEFSIELVQICWDCVCTQEMFERVSLFWKDYDKSDTSVYYLCC